MMINSRTHGKFWEKNCVELCLLDKFAVFGNISKYELDGKGVPRIDFFL